MLTTIAIVGRPNVGKSTLFNRLTKTRNALVGNLPGLTRDRQYGTAIIDNQKLIIVDTGGIGEVTNEIETLMEKQAWFAVQESNVIIFLVDARNGLTSADEIIAQELRKLGKPIYLAINKIDGLDSEIASADFYSLGFENIYLVSAEHNVGISALLHAIIKQQEVMVASDNETIPGIAIDEKPIIKIAFVGRPNVGKSTLVNRILGEERVIVYDSPGTTRDSIFINFNRRGKDYVLIDTAGIRRRGKVGEGYEKFSVIKALQAIEAANVVVLLIDGSETISDQDLKLLSFVLDAGKALVIAINKWDGLSIEQRDTVRRDLDRRLTFIDFAEMYFISALHGTGVGNLFTAIDKAYDSATRDLKTQIVTQILAAAVETHQPPLVHGHRVKLRYAHVGGHNPPIIVIHGSHVGSIPESYRKYLEHYFREKLKLAGTPIRIEFKE